LPSDDLSKLIVLFKELFKVLSLEFLIISLIDITKLSTSCDPN
jgi:hypothetical protein